MKTIEKEIEMRELPYTLTDTNTVNFFCPNCRYENSIKAYSDVFTYTNRISGCCASCKKGYILIKK